MKKTIIGGMTAIGIFAITSLKAQPISDHVVIPIGVTLVQIARINVNEGGNVEFVFNTIDDYKNGISTSEGGSSSGLTAGGTELPGFYQTDIEFASSHQWTILMGTEDEIAAAGTTFRGTDDPDNTSFPINNVGFRMDWSGLYSCCAAGSDVSATAHDAISAAGTFGDPNGLQSFQLSITGPDVLFNNGGTTNYGGDVDDLSFRINWECGTANTDGTTPMNAVSILGQNLAPDRYVGNVFIDLNVFGP